MFIMPFSYVAVALYPPLFILNIDKRRLPHLPFRHHSASDGNFPTFHFIKMISDFFRTHSLPRCFLFLYRAVICFLHKFAVRARNIHYMDTDLSSHIRQVHRSAVECGLRSLHKSFLQ